MDSITKEEWRFIPGYEGRYMVSNLGRIKSLYTNRNIHGEIMKIAREHILSQTDNGNGYQTVSIINQGKHKNIYVHRAVAMAFLERSPDQNTINHKDFNTHNNHVDNLEWCTQKENVAYSREHMKKTHRSASEISGYKYITRRNNRFRVCIRGETDRTFKTFNDALLYRDKVVMDLYGVDNAG